MNMKIYSEWDEFVDVDFSRYSRRELYEEMCRIYEVSADGREIEKKLKDIDRKYASITKQHGTLEDWFESPLKLLRLTEEELKSILPEMQQEGVQQSHIRRLLHLGEKGVSDFALWEKAQPPQGSADLASAAYNLQLDIVTLLAGPKALKQIGRALQRFVDSKLAVMQPSELKKNPVEAKVGRGRPPESKMLGHNILYCDNSAEIPKAADLAYSVCSILFRYTEKKNRKDWQVEWLDVHEQMEGSVELQGKDLQKAKKRIKNTVAALNRYTTMLSVDSSLFDWNKGLISRMY